MEYEEMAAVMEIKTLKKQVEIQKTARHNAEFVAHSWEAQAGQLARVLDEIKENETLWNIHIRDKARRALADYADMKNGAAAPAHPQHNSELTDAKRSVQ